MPWPMPPHCLQNLKSVSALVTARLMMCWVPVPTWYPHCTVFSCGKLQRSPQMLQWFLSLKIVLSAAFFTYSLSESMMLCALFKSVTLNTVICLFYCDIVAKIVCYFVLPNQHIYFPVVLFILCSYLRHHVWIVTHRPYEGFIDLGT